MRIFLTGATGFIGSHIVPELLAAGHEVLGTARSDDGAARLQQAGADVYRATLEAPEELAQGATMADAVIHTAFDHDFSRFVENCEKDARVIEALGAAIAGSERPLIITSGVGLGIVGPGELAREDVINLEHANPRRASELAGEKLSRQGVSVAAMRLPQVHDTHRQGLVTPLIELARRTGVSAYVGDGANRMSAAHVHDVARLYRLALEGHRAGARWNAVDEEGVPLRDIAQAIGDGLGVPVESVSPEEATTHFGWLGMFAHMDLAASSALTREKLGWAPSGPSLIEDLRQMDYDAIAAP